MVETQTSWPPLQRLSAENGLMKGLPTDSNHARFLIGVFPSSCGRQSTRLGLNGKVYYVCVRGGPIGLISASTQDWAADNAVIGRAAWTHGQGAETVTYVQFYGQG